MSYMSFKKTLNKLENDKEILEDKANNQKKKLEELRNNNQEEVVDGFITELEELKNTILNSIEKSKNKEKKEVYKDKLITVEEYLAEAKKLKSKIKDRSREINDTLENFKIKEKEILEAIQETTNSFDIATKIQEKSLNLLYSSFIMLVSGCIAIYQVQNIERLIEGLNAISSLYKVVIYMVLVCIIEANVIYLRSVNKADYFAKNNIEPKYSNIIKLPNWIEISLLVYSFIFLFIPNLALHVFRSEMGILVSSIVNTFFIGLLALESKDVINTLIETFKKSVSDPKDRITVTVAVVGTVISIISIIR